MGALLNLLTMFGPLRALKFWTAAAMALIQFLQIYSGINLGLDQGTVTTVLAGVGALLVWLVPNLKPKLPTLTEADVRNSTGYSGPIEDRSGL
jgi:hypothetical protein